MTEYFKKFYYNQDIRNANYFDTVEDVLKRHAFHWGLSNWDKFQDGIPLRNLIHDYIENEKEEVKEYVYEILNKRKYTYSFIEADKVLELEPGIYMPWVRYWEHMDFFKNLVERWQNEIRVTEL